MPLDRFLWLSKRAKFHDYSKSRFTHLVISTHSPMSVSRKTAAPSTRQKGIVPPYPICDFLRQRFTPSTPTRAYYTVVPSLYLPLLATLSYWYFVAFRYSVSHYIVPNKPPLQAVFLPQVFFHVPSFNLRFEHQHTRGYLPLFCRSLYQVNNLSSPC